jgi:predicted DNA-binding ribbon-helix-helix protein
MPHVKTAISLEKLLLHRIDDVASDLGMPRSQLLARAAEEFLRRYESAKLLAALNEAHAEGPDAEEVERRRAWKYRHRRQVKGSW